MSSEVRQRIRAHRDKFEAAWIAGETPRMEDLLDGFSEEGRAPLLRALLAVEIEYRRDRDGGPLSEQQLLEVHPDLAMDLKLAFQELRSMGTDRGGDRELTLLLPRSEAGIQRTVEHKASGKGSRGLHIRCPHCSNHVELVTDTPYEEICCSTCGSTFSLVDRSDTTEMASPLKTIDRFDLVARLGVGGFGTVWKARDKDLDRVVAVKIPRRGQLEPMEVEQFFREARTAAQLRHPNIVPVHEVGREDDTLFIVSDFVRGVSLSDWLTGGCPSNWEIAEMCFTIANALHYAHQQGVVHRDMKPSNIMIDQTGQPHLMDFGLAKREVGEVTMTVEGQILGTPAYMSPEQAGGEGHWTDRRTDIYSLGVILFELLTGELPFRGNTQMQIHQRLTDDAPDPRKLNRHIPADLATICVKCMEREPGRRYSTASAVADELERFMRGEPIEARPISAPARLMRWAKRKPLMATTAALVLFLAVAGPMAALLIERQRSRLAELVTEKNHLIDQYAVEKQLDTNRISELSQSLDLWEGRANPWEFWPPEREKSPRQNLLKEFLNHQSNTLGSQVSNGNLGIEEQARAYLSLAIMADALGQAPEAIENYQHARDQLAQLREQRPEQPQFSRALAECNTDLARLVGDADRSEAAQLFESAREIGQQLATEHKTDPEYQIAWLESELRCATLAGFEPGQEHLSRVAQISRSLSSAWPSDPTAAYRLACYLTEREPILLSSTASSAP